MQYFFLQKGRAELCRFISRLELWFTKIRIIPEYITNEVSICYCKDSY